MIYKCKTHTHTHTHTERERKRESERERERSVVFRNLEAPDACGALGRAAAPVSRRTLVIAARFNVTG